MKNGATRSNPMSTAVSGVSYLNPCKNQRRDGKETDVDCGGGLCPKCADRKWCIVSSDCLSNLCVYNVCLVSRAPYIGFVYGALALCCIPSASASPFSPSLQPATCKDSILSGAESDVDCGGGLCLKCDQGRRCRAPSDCKNGLSCIKQICRVSKRNNSKACSHGIEHCRCGLATSHCWKYTLVP